MVRADLSEIETRNKTLNETKIWFFETINKLTNLEKSVKEKTKTYQHQN